MDVNLIEKQPFFDKTTLQGERDCEDQFWHVPVPKPNLFFPSNNNNEVYEKDKTSSPNLSMPNINESQVGGETFLNRNPYELRVYTRRKFHKTSGDHPVNLEQDQSQPLSSQALGISTASIPSPTLFTDLDIPIALRKA